MWLVIKDIMLMEQQDGTTLNIRKPEKNNGKKIVVKIFFLKRESKGKFT